MAKSDTPMDHAGLFAQDVPSTPLNFAKPRPFTARDMLEGWYRSVTGGALVGIDATASSALDYVFGPMTPRLAERLNNLANWCDRQVEREKRAREEQQLADYSPFDAEET